ncbi:uncharacterized protein LOC131224305 [Magnolia sinica]|uniref:uncharacterized protein LOC131224305 n=1 Tax=Magnolia sinica TaxID=86752 RepID=UPI002657F84F|nr:uncharacterized protein LOC131224305 [Magnolia sinica]
MTFDQVVHRALVYEEDWALSQRTGDQSSSGDQKRRAPSGSSRQHRHQRREADLSLGSPQFSQQLHHQCGQPLLSLDLFPVFAMDMGRQGIRGVIALSPCSSRGHRNYLLPILLSSSSISSEHNIRLPSLGLLLSSRGSQVGLHSSNNSSRGSNRGDRYLPHSPWVEFGDMFLPADLLVLPMVEFDVILGMDWLAEYHAVLECATRTVTFHIPSLPVFQFVVEARGESLSSLLACIVEESVTGCIKQLPVVYDYPDVFQEISGLMPHRQIEF